MFTLAIKSALRLPRFEFRLGLGSFNATSQLRPMQTVEFLRWAG